MANDSTSAIRAGAMAAGRLLRHLNLHASPRVLGGSVDVFAAINDLDLPLLVRPLKGLLGAFLNEDAPGILVTTERRLSIQRFTAAHELGHFWMKHEPSLDDEDNILRRAPIKNDQLTGFQETEANAFAAAFLMPKWLIMDHCIRRGWQTSDLANPAVVYQLSLRLCTSYEATCRTLENYRLISFSVMTALLESEPRDLKIALLEGFIPADYKGDVWLITELDRDARIEGCENDIFVVRLKEHSASGYIWDFEQFQQSGFTFVNDRKIGGISEAIGGPVTRSVTALPKGKPSGSIRLDERRPWESGPPEDSVIFDFDLSGPEPKGLSRAERRARLEAV